MIVCSIELDWKDDAAQMWPRQAGFWRIGGHQQVKAVPPALEVVQAMYEPSEGGMAASLVCKFHGEAAVMISINRILGYDVS